MTTLEEILKINMGCDMPFCGDGSLSFEGEEAVEKILELLRDLASCGIIPDVSKQAESRLQRLQVNLAHPKETVFSMSSAVPTTMQMLFGTCTPKSGRERFKVSSCCKNSKKKEIIMEEKRIDGKTLKEWIAERLDEETILVPRIQGDGQKLVMLYMVATPSYEWLLQIDSRQELTADYADELLSIIEDQYGTYPEHGIVTKEEYDDAKAKGEIWADCYEDFEEYEYRCNFPVPNIICGYGWDEIVNFGKE